MARRFGLGAPVLKAAVRSGALRGCQPGRRTVYVFESDVREWLAGLGVREPVARPSRRLFERAALRLLAPAIEENGAPT